MVFAQHRRADTATKLTPFAALAVIAFLSQPDRATAEDAPPPVAAPVSASVAVPDGSKVTVLDSIAVSGDWLGTGLENSVKSFAGARTVVDRQEINQSGATSIGDVLRRVPGVQSTDNSGSAGSAVSLNIGVRGLTGRYTPRSTVLLDGIPLAVAPYGQPQLSFAPISLDRKSVV